MDKKKFRLSYSLLSLWSQGFITEAINTYLHREVIATPQIIEGRRLHEEWATSITTSKKLILGSTEISFVNPLCEYGSKGELNKPYNDLWDIGGRFDVLDTNTLYEFKSGKTNSLTYANGFQVPFYFLLGELSGIKIDKAMIYHWNQYTKETDFMLVWNDPTHIEKARNWIDTIVPDIHSFFKKNNIIG